MSVRASTWAWEQGRAGTVKGGELLTLLRVADHADNDGICWPGEKSIADYTGQDERTVRRHLGQLEAAGLLHRERQASAKGSGRANDRILLRTDPPDKLSGGNRGVQPDIDDVSTGQIEQVQPDIDDTALYREPSKEPSENPQERDVVNQLFELWRSATNRPNARLTIGRRKKIGARLREGYAPEQIAQAITNVACSPFHQGKNDRGRRFDDLELICRDGDHVEKYLELAPPPSGRRTVVDFEESRRALREKHGAAT